jgi:hypothetical protein
MPKTNKKVLVSKITSKNLPTADSYTPQTDGPQTPPDTIALRYKAALEALQALEHANRANAKLRHLAINRVMDCEPEASIIHHGTRSLAFDKPLKELTVADLAPLMDKHPNGKPLYFLITRTTRSLLAMDQIIHSEYFLAEAAYRWVSANQSMQASIATALSEVGTPSHPKDPWVCSLKIEPANLPQNFFERTQDNNCLASCYSTPAGLHLWQVDILQ